MERTGAPLPTAGSGVPGVTPAPPDNIELCFVGNGALTYCFKMTSRIIQTQEINFGRSNRGSLLFTTALVSWQTDMGRFERLVLITKFIQSFGWHASSSDGLSWIWITGSIINDNNERTQWQPLENMLLNYTNSNIGSLPYSKNMGHTWLFIFSSESQLSIMLYDFMIPEWYKHDIDTNSNVTV